MCSLTINHVWGFSPTYSEEFVYLKSKTVHFLSCLFIFWPSGEPEQSSTWVTPENRRSPGSQQEGASCGQHDGKHVEDQGCDRGDQELCYHGEEHFSLVCFQDKRFVFDQSGLDWQFYNNKKTPIKKRFPLDSLPDPLTAIFSHHLQRHEPRGASPSQRPGRPESLHGSGSGPR